jgi:predicted SnoaL-like aldol condensation-catalyzing enzyme
MKKMKLALALSTTLFGLALGSQVLAQEPVVGVANPESLFKDKNAMMNTNKQAALHIMRELLQCNHWNDAGNWLTDKYIQHNPNAASGLKGVVTYFTTVAKRPVVEKCDVLTTEIVAVVAEGDRVIVVTPRHLDDPTKPGEKYYTTWFDMWRFVGGKADEHWDGATKAAPPAAK